MKLMRLLIVSCIVTMSACGSGNQTPNPLAVKVIDPQGKAIVNATVVLGTEDGLVAAFSATDNLGKASFDPAPSNATVTAALSCYSPSANRTYHYADIAYGVTVSAVTLTLGTCDEDTRSVTVKVTDRIAGVTSHDVTLGPITYSGSSVTMDVNGSLQDDGGISVFATGYGDPDNIRGYGFALDQPAVDGTVIDIGIDRTAIVKHTHRFGNVPLNAVSYYAFASLLRKHAATNLPFNFASGMAPLPAAVTTYSAGGFADSHLFGAAVMLDRDSDGQADAEIGLVRYLRDSSDQYFDFGSAPVAPGALTYNPGVAGRPIISWSNGDPRSTVQNLALGHSATTPQRSSFYCTMTVPASASSLVYPELPEILAAFRPAAYSNLSLQAVKFEGPVSYTSYLQAIASNNGRFYEAAGLNSYSFAGISRLP